MVGCLVGLLVVLVLRVGLLVVLVLSVGLLVVLVLCVGLLVVLVLCVVFLVDTVLAVVVCLAWLARLIKVRPHRPQGGWTHRPQGTLLKVTSMDVPDCPIKPSRESRRRARADAMSICVRTTAFLLLLCSLPAS